MSSYNLLEEAPIGAQDLDISVTGAGLTGGYYLDQAASPAVDSGSRSAADAGLDARYTDPGTDAPRTDGGTVDRGYHYAAAYVAADDYAVDPPVDTIIDPGIMVRVTPLRGGQALGAGHKVIVTLARDLVRLQSSANVDPLGDGRSVILGDLASGAYVFQFGEPLALGATTLYVQIDDVTMPRTLMVIVKECNGPPETCHRAGGDVLLRTPGNDPHDEHRGDD